ncbi:MAG: winged helix-turn-helix transcriptional regulator [Usitatibacter sp.]
MKSGFGQICPVAVACEVFAERWTPIILREMFAGSQHFNEIRRGVPLMSSALLAHRLRSLEANGVIESESLPVGRGRRYRLTEAGREFQSVIEGLGTWGQRWTVRVERDNLDPGFLMWNVRRRIALDRVPARRTVVRLKFGGVPVRYRGPRIFWLMLDRTQSELCIEDPGFEVDLHVEADLASLARVWLGDIAFENVVRSGKIRLTGPRKLAEAFPTWLKLSHFAGVDRPHRGQAVTA